MIEARPTPLARRLAVAYFRRRARRRLAGLYGASMERLAPWEKGHERESGDPGPLIIVANHSSWWDAVMPILISLDLYNHNAYGVMVEEELAKFRFFRRIGMFSIDRKNPRSAMRSLQYGADLLRRTDRVLWYYPQGEIVPNDRRPVAIESGIARLVEMIGEVTVIPLALRYELLDNERPDVWMRCGEVTRFGGKHIETREEIRDRIHQRLVATMDEVKHDVIRRDLVDYETILAGAGSISDRWDRIRPGRERY